MLIPIISNACTICVVIHVKSRLVMKLYIVNISLCNHTFLWIEAWMTEDKDIYLK